MPPNTIFLFIPFMRQLTVDSSAEEIARVEEILKSQQIPYRINSIRTRGDIGSALDARSYARSNIALYKGSATPSVIYRIYVRRRDYAWEKNLYMEIKVIASGYYSRTRPG